jgi:hypothetical protein
MSTRRLVLLALLCGLAILLAGGVKLVQVVGEQPVVQVLSFGESARLGDVDVTVLGVRNDERRTIVEVSLAGPAGTDAVTGWRLLARIDGRVGDPLEPVVDPEDVPSACTVLAGADEPVVCSIVFAPTERVSVVAYGRAGEQRQWSPRT